MALIVDEKDATFHFEFFQLIKIDDIHIKDRNGAEILTLIKPNVSLFLILN